MSRFVDVYDAEEQCNTGQRIYAERMFNAGMERAAEIVKEERTELADPLYNLALDDAAELIRKEIDND